jgi:hypothetical protein
LGEERVGEGSGEGGVGRGSHLSDIYKLPTFDGYIEPVNSSMRKGLFSDIVEYIRLD